MKTLKGDFTFSAGVATACAVGGAYIGKGIGIVAFGGGIAGTIPVAAAAAIVGGLGTYAYRKARQQSKLGKTIMKERTNE